MSTGQTSSTACLLLCFLLQCDARGMFESRTAERLGHLDTTQLNYGVAVTDVDGDGYMEWIIAGYNGPNTVLKYDHVTGKYVNLTHDERFVNLTDSEGEAVSVCACDIDGGEDGREEIYFMNINDRYWGEKEYKDKLFKFRNGRYENIYDDSVNQGISHMYSGRSVACVDRTGNGKYGFLLATYARGSSGRFALIEMDETASDVASGRIVLASVGDIVGVNKTTGGQGIAVGPIIGDKGYSDIFFDNEGNTNPGDNCLYQNDGHGFFRDVANETGVSDGGHNGRGIALADFNNDGLMDITYGNWLGPHRLYLQRPNTILPQFEDVGFISPEFAEPSPIRTVIAADFDNDGVLEVFKNNIVYRPYNGIVVPTYNSLFEVIPYGHSVDIRRKMIGDAYEIDMYGTGAAVADMDEDGQLELLISHGETTAQPLTIYNVQLGGLNNWIRIMPLTAAGAPARGALVTITLEDDTEMRRVIDGGSGYLCQMEPVAHFGLGTSSLKRLKIQWPGSHMVSMSLPGRVQNTYFKVAYSGQLLPVTKRDPGRTERPTSGGHSFRLRWTGILLVAFIFALFSPSS